MKVLTENKFSNVFPMRVTCKRVVNEFGFSYGKKKDLSESLLATNNGNIEFHFAINVETGKFDLYDGVELLADCPEWWLPKSDSENIEEEPVEPETPSEGEVTDPETPSGEETDAPVEEGDTTEAENPSGKEEEEPQPGSPDTEPEPNEDGTTV